MDVYIPKGRVSDLLESLEKRELQRVNKTIGLLQKYGNNISMPFSKSLGNGLFELRIIGVVHVRIIYTFHDNVAFVLHAFIKKGNKIPKNDLDLALIRKKLLR